MHRRMFLYSGVVFTHACSSASCLLAALRAERWERAADVLRQATEKKQVEAAVLHVSQRGEASTYPFGKAADGDAMFLLGSISKPINIAAVMTLFDEGQFRLEERVQKFLPMFTGEGREQVTIQHLLTHTSGLPDQLSENNALRRQHAPLGAFVERTFKTPLAFVPGSRYQYSSMGILLATAIAERISGVDMLTLVERRILQRLEMSHSAQGVGRFGLNELVSCQMEGAAPESGSGDPTAKLWDWNSPYWRKLGAPWGGTHASAPDVGRFLGEFLYARGQALRPDTAKLITRNHNAPGLVPRGLGFGVGKGAGSAGCSDQTFGHTGSTGTLCWADPARDTICVVLTSLPARAIQPHPRDLAAQQVASRANG